MARKKPKRKKYSRTQLARMGLADARPVSTQRKAARAGHPLRSMQKTPAAIARAKERFCLDYAELKNISASAARVGVSRRTVHQWRHDDEDFARAMDEAWESIVDQLEASAMARAIDGYMRPIFQGGVRVGSERVHHPQLTTFMLTHNRRSRYRERVEVEVTPEEYARRVREAFASQDAAASAAAGPAERVVAPSPRKRRRDGGEDAGDVAD